jgi:hypothetical protein
MTLLKSNHDAPLPVPGGPTIKPFATVSVDNFEVLQHNDIVKSWLAAEVITVVKEKPAKTEKPD